MWEWLPWRGRSGRDGGGWVLSWILRRGLGRLVFGLVQWVIRRTDVVCCWYYCCVLLILLSLSHCGMKVVAFKKLHCIVSLFVRRCDEFVAWVGLIVAMNQRYRTIEREANEHASTYLISHVMHWSKIEPIKRMQQYMYKQQQHST